MCKHFGFTSQYVNEDMPVLPDWYCCISVALDAEEEEAYMQQRNAYMAAGGDLKKFPKRPQRYTQVRRTEMAEENPFDIVMGAMKGAKVPTARGNINEYAKTRGLQKVFQMPDGTIVDDAGKPVEPTPGSIFVKSE